MSLLGLDLSMRAAAAVALPLDWAGDWERVPFKIVSAPLPKTATDMQRAVRTESIADRIVEFALAHGCKETWIESYGFNMRTSGHTLAELGGVVRLELARAGVELHTANMSAARKLMCGSIPRKADKKAWVEATLQSAGCPWTSPDVRDAFVCVNWGMAERGGYALVHG